MAVIKYITINIICHRIGYEWIAKLIKLLACCEFVSLLNPQETAPVATRLCITDPANKALRLRVSYPADCEYVLYRLPTPACVLEP